MDTLQKAKDDLRENFDVGSECQCCGQFVKRYKRALNSSMSGMLIAVYINSGREYVHVNKLLSKNPRFRSVAGGGDFTKLAHWGLVEQQLGKRADGSKRNGWWRVTQRGEDFINQKILVASHVYLYNGNFIGYEEKSISILKSLGKKFNYDELMAGI